MAFKSSPSTDDILKILAINSNGLKVLKNELEKYIVGKETELVRKCYELESENRRLKEESILLRAKLSRYEKKSETNENNDSQDLLVKLNQEIGTSIKELASQANANRTTRDVELLKYHEEYENCRENLQKLNLRVSNEYFEEKVKVYRDVCEQNDLVRKDTFRKLYEIAKVSCTKLEEQKILSSALMAEIRPFVEAQREKLFEMKKILCAYGMERENTLYEEMLKLAKDEITLFNNLLQYNRKANDEKKIELD